jgi:hypothetical protein
MPEEENIRVEKDLIDVSGFTQTVKTQTSDPSGQATTNAPQTCWNCENERRRQAIPPNIGRDCDTSHTAYFFLWRCFLNLFLRLCVAIL